MFALLFLILATLVGHQVLVKLLPRLATLTQNPVFAGNRSQVPAWMLVVPTSFYLGVILMTWCAYFATYFSVPFSDTPLMPGNIITFAVFTAGFFALSRFKKERNIRWEPHAFKRDTLLKFVRDNRCPLIYTALVFAIAAFIMIFTLHMQDSHTLAEGRWEWGDFGQHLAMIRSFSKGSNFPTGFSHFANDHIHYHFMIHFLAGNLEFLGFNLADAFDWPPIFFLTGFGMLVYVFAGLLTDTRAVAYLTMAFFYFRSSFAVFTFLRDPLVNLAPDAWPLAVTWDHVWHVNTWIGNLPIDNWGQWPMSNALVGQRHNSLGFGMMVLVLLYLLPVYFQMMTQLNDQKPLSRAWWQTLFFKAQGWLPQSPFQTALMGVFLGLACFWNGPMVIATLMILGALVLVTGRRLEFGILLVVTVLLGFVEDRFFGAHTGSAFAPVVKIGYMAAHEDLWTITRYTIESFGFLPLLYLAGLVILPKGRRWLAFCFVMPFLFGNVIQFSVQLMSNQKFFYASLLFFDFVAGYTIYRLFTCRAVVLKSLAVLLCLILTATGIVDAVSFVNVNKDFIQFNLSDPMTVWVEEFTDPHAVFLTFPYVGHQLLLSGRKMFLGWPYYPWVAGHDTKPREETERQIYGGKDPQKVRQLLYENRINYVVIDESNRACKEYVLNEPLFQKNFPIAYKAPSGDFTIYKVD